MGLWRMSSPQEKLGCFDFGDRLKNNEEYKRVRKVCRLRSLMDDMGLDAAQESFDLRNVFQSDLVFAQGCV